MKNVLKAEEFFLFLFGIYMFSQLNFSWWWFLALLFTPDISMLGYFMNSKIGAFIYNLFHHKGIAIICYFLGMYFQNQMVQLIGIILFSHASIDRFFGYGLKFVDSFNNTHLGQIGKK